MELAYIYIARFKRHWFITSERMKVKRTSATLETLEFLITETKLAVDRFYRYYEDLIREFNAKLLDTRTLVSYKNTVDKANKWINEARITRSFVSEESCKHLKVVCKMVSIIIDKSLAELGLKEMKKHH